MRVRQSGRIKVSVKEWARTRKNVARARNAWLHKLLTYALEVYKISTSEADVEDAVEKVAEVYDLGSPVKVELNRLFRRTGWRRPRRGTVEMVFTASDAEFDIYVDDETFATVKIENGKRTFVWESEGRFRDIVNHPMAMKFFSILCAVPWNTRSGGKIMEYRGENPKKGRVVAEWNRKTVPLWAMTW